MSSPTTLAGITTIPTCPGSSSRPPTTQTDLKTLGGVTPPAGLVAYELDGLDVGVDNTIVSEGLKVAPSFDRYLLQSTEAHAQQPSPEVGRFHRSLLPLHDPEQIAARFLLAEGTLAATAVDDQRQWRWLAQEIFQSFEIAEDALHLRLEGQSGSQILVVTPPPEGGPIELLVGNTMAADVFPGPGTPPTTDPHVKLYYDMASLPVPASLRYELESPSAGPLAHPPQASHPHRILRTASASSDAPPSHDHGGHRAGEGVTVGPRRVGGANCQPNEWNG